MQAFEPSASVATNDGVGDIRYAASARGPTVYTAFIASRDVIARRQDEFLAVMRADIADACSSGCTTQGPCRALTQATASFFPGVATEVLNRAFRRYLAAGLWAREPTMSEEGFVRLGQSLHSGGFIARMAVYDACIEPSLNGPHP